MTDQPPAESANPSDPAPVQRVAKRPALISVEPVEVDSRKILVTLTAGWLLALIVLLAMWNWLGEHGHRSWIWTAVAGTLLGLAGIVLAGRHRSAGRTR